MSAIEGNHMCHVLHKIRQVTSVELYRLPMFMLETYILLNNPTLAHVCFIILSINCEMLSYDINHVFMLFNIV